jgi:hypothetical protein
LSVFVASPIAFYLLWRSGQGLAAAEATRIERACAAGEATPA